MWSLKKTFWVEGKGRGGVGLGQKDGDRWGGRGEVGYKRELDYGSKNLDSSLPFGQVILKFFLPCESLSLLLNALGGRQLVWSIAHWTSENEKLLAQKDDWKSF